MELLILQTPTCSGYKLLTSGTGAHPFTVYIPNKIAIFISTPAGLKSKFLTNSIPVKAYVVFHKLKPTTFLPNSIFFKEMELL